MSETITAIETITLRIPLDIWAPPPMTQDVPRTHVESLYVRVTTSGGVVGWGESFGTGRAMVNAAFDNWIRRHAVGQNVLDEALIPRIERMLLSLSRSGPLAHALAGLDIALWDIRGNAGALGPAKEIGYLGPAFLAALHCLAAKDKESPLERMFADFGATPFAKTVPVINGAVEVPQGPGLGADPEDDLIARFRV
jgi:L-alanine-DL-glutamate epimerase-like enolase superfamily enzyme